MHQERVLDPADYFQAGESAPPRIVITESQDAAIVCWHLEPGQRIELHTHPTGQDTWVVLSGEGVYLPDRNGTALPLRPGVIAVASRGAVHGAENNSAEPLRFISIVSPSLSGFEPIDEASSNGK